MYLSPHSSSINISNSEILHSIPLSSERPKHGQILTYNADLNHWVFENHSSHSGNSVNSILHMSTETPKNGQTIVYDSLQKRWIYVDGNKPLSFYNTYYGNLAGEQSKDAAQNSAFGNSALESNRSAIGNTAVGYNAMQNYDSNVVSNNTSIGVNSCCSLTTGIENVAIGSDSLCHLSTGSFNIGIGSNAGQSYTADNRNNIILGRDIGNPDDNGVMRLGSPGNTTKTIMQGVYNNNIVSGTYVQVKNDGTIGVLPSSRRYKENITDAKQYDVSKLRVCNYNYKHDELKIEQVGLIAEEVDSIYPELVGHDSSGRPNTVELMKLIPILLQRIQILESNFEKKRQQKKDQQ
jgi:Chaperone of endosialidase